MASSPVAGDSARYAGGEWTVSAVTADPSNLGSFVDLVRVDDPTITARVHSSQLARDTADGWTFQDQPALPGNRSSGDPRYPLTPEFIDKHQRFNQLVERVACELFSRSRWTDDGGWESLAETRKSQLRALVRAVVMNQPLPPLPQGVTATQARNRVMALLPQDLKDWLTANPQ